MSLPRAELLIDSNDPYQRNLYTALKHILITLPLATNRFCDYAKSATWSKSQVSVYNTPGVWQKNQSTTPKWTWYPDFPAGLPMMKCADKGTQLSLRKNFEYQTNLNQTSPLISEAVSSLELMMDFYEILQVQERRFGNCGDRTKMLMMYLWEHSTGIRRLEYAALAKFDHAVLIVNRQFHSQLHKVNT